MKIMKGVSYITDDRNRKTAVVIDLKKYAEIWEDFFDYLVVSQRKDEDKVPLEKVIKDLKKLGKLSKDV
jgi:hypothetical protein